MALSCPNCRIDMQESVTQKVTIDSCERCEVNWLDGGELRRIAVAPDSSHPV